MLQNSSSCVTKQVELLNIFWTDLENVLATFNMYVSFDGDRFLGGNYNNLTKHGGVLCVAIYGYTATLCLKRRSNDFYVRGLMEVEEIDLTLCFESLHNLLVETVRTLYNLEFPEFPLSK